MIFFKVRKERVCLKHPGGFRKRDGLSLYDSAPLPSAWRPQQFRTYKNKAVMFFRLHLADFVLVIRHFSANAFTVTTTSFPLCLSLKSKNNLWLSYKQFHKVSSSSGRQALPATKTRKGIILKRVGVNRPIAAIRNFHYGRSPGTYGNALVRFI